MLPATDKIRILVVDDDAFVREFLADVLQEHGFEVQTANDGLDALDKFASDPKIGLVVSDINMPVMDGLQFLRQLRTMNLDVPVVMVTSVREISVAVEALQAGAADYVIKDEGIRDTIGLTVRKALERRQLKEQNVQLIADLAVKTEELESALSHLKELDRMKDDFISTVSHELRTPLTSILGFVKIIGKRLEEVVFPRTASNDPKTARAIDQVRGNIGIIEAEGVRLTALINDMLDLAKMEAGKMEWKQEPCSMAEIIDRAASAVSSLFEQKGVPLVRDVEEGLPPVTGDGDRLIQVVLNLLSNAVKFTETGAVTIKARRTNPPLEKGDAGGFTDGVLISVVDTGQGIPPHDLPKVFDKFKQAGSTLTDKPRGTGLGLPISRHIVERHGGRIWAESELGKGCVFFVALPVVK